jgi:hypothetical protein
MIDQVAYGITEALKRRRKAQAPPPEADNHLASSNFRPVVKNPDRSFTYARRHRGQWYAPEYDFRQIQIAQDVDGIVGQSINKATDKFLVAGWSYTGKSNESIEYLKRRLDEMSVVSKKPWDLLLTEAFTDLRRYRNVILMKIRNRRASTGKRRRIPGRNEPLDPIACYVILPFEQIEFKADDNGHVRFVRQKLANGEYGPDIPTEDFVHITYHKKPGFTVGTPALLPALEDVRLLRRIEENVEELVETNLFPVYHYKIGSDKMPEKWDPHSNEKESDIVKRQIEYMPASGMYITDHRHEIEVLGSESKALRIDGYISHFLKRAIAACDITPVDLGMEGELNRSTANTLTKSMSMSIEALQKVMKIHLDFYVISELLLEGGYDPYDQEDKVEITFGVIDQEQRMAMENQANLLFSTKMMTQTEARERIGYQPMTVEQQDDTYYKLYEEPLALLKLMEPGGTATSTLAETPTSNITPETQAEGEKRNEEMMKKEAKAKAAGRPPGGSSTGQKRASAAKSRPSNQHGTRTGPKSDQHVIEIPELGISFLLDFIPEPHVLMDWKVRAISRWERVKDSGVSKSTLIENLLPSLRRS